MGKIQNIVFTFTVLACNPGLDVRGDSSRDTVTASLPAPFWKATSREYRKLFFRYNLKSPGTGGRKLGTQFPKYLTLA